MKCVLSVAACNSLGPDTIPGARTRASDGKKLQDLGYTLDPVGSTLRISDGAQQSLFYADAFVAPVNEFVYNAVSRLISATGRAHASIGGYRAHDFAPARRSER